MALHPPFYPSTLTHPATDDTTWPSLGSFPSSGTFPSLPDTTAEDAGVIAPFRIRELPPLRLAVNVSPPSGETRRWALDEAKAENVLSGLTFSASAPGGFESCSLSLPRRPKITYPDLERLSNVTVTGAGQIAWEGRIESVPRSSGEGTEVSPEIVGWQAHLSDDKTVTAVYVDRDLGNWQTMAGPRKAALYAFGVDVIQDHSVEPDITTGLPRLTLHANGNWPDSNYSEAWYDAGEGNEVASVYFSYVARVTDSAFNGALSSYTDDHGGGSLAGSGDLIATGTDTGSTTATPSTAQRYAAFALTLTSTPATADIDRDFTVYNVAVWGNTGLSKRGTAPDNGVYASDVITHALGYAPRLRYSSDTISTSSYAIKQAVFKESTTVSEIISTVNRFMLADWFVWEGSRPGQPTFYYHARGARGRNWKARVGPSKLAETGASIENLWNGVIVRYQDVDGTTKTVGPTSSNADVTTASLVDSDPSNPANRAGIRRWDILDHGGVATLADATALGNRFLVEARRFDTSGQAQIVGHVEDDRGIVHPAWQIRPGDTISFVDAADTSPRRVIKTSYSDDAKTNSIDLDAPPDALAALLERLQVVLVPLGL